MVAHIGPAKVKWRSMIASTSPHEIHIDRLADADRPWVEQFIRDRWGATTVVAHGVVYHPHTLPGFVARIGDTRAGLLTYSTAGDELEIVTIDSLQSGTGIGTALIEAAKEEAIRGGFRRVWLITTNDNLNALRFYQKRGFLLVAVHRNALERSRTLKPEIPLTGAHGIPLRDEIELEYLLTVNA